MTIQLLVLQEKSDHSHLRWTRKTTVQREDQADLRRSEVKPPTNLLVECYSSTDIAEAQHEDDDLSFILFYLRERKSPPDNIIALSSPAAKMYLVKKEKFYVNQDNVLCNISKHGIHRLVVPRKYIEEVTRLNHDLVCTGHQGIQRTIEKLKAKFYWYCLDEFVKN